METTIKMKELRKNLFQVTVVRGAKEVVANFKLTFWMRRSTSKLTKAMQTLKMEIEDAMDEIIIDEEIQDYFQITIIQLYDALSAVCEIELPGVYMS